MGCYEIDFKVSRRSHLFSDFRKALWLREFDTTVMQHHAGQHENLVAAGLAHGCFRFDDSIGGDGWLVANWVKACGINAKKKSILW